MASVPPERAQLFLNLLVAEVSKEIQSLQLWGTPPNPLYVVDGTIHPGVVDAIESLTAMGASINNAVVPVGFCFRDVSLPVLREFVRLGFDINTELGVHHTTLMSCKMRRIPDEVMEYLLVEMGGRVDPASMDRATGSSQRRVQRVLVGRSITPLLWVVHRDLVRVLLGYLVASQSE